VTTSQETPTQAIISPKVLLGNHVKTLKLPPCVRQYEGVHGKDRTGYPGILPRHSELKRTDSAAQ
jgi:hypothetical protein